MTAALRLPAFYLPIPTAVHPEAASLSRNAADWLNRCGLCGSQQQRDRVAQADVGLLTAMMAPTGRTETVQLITDFLIWLVAFDDEFCDEGPFSRRPHELTDLLVRFQRIIESPETERPESDPYGQALLDIRRRLSACAGPELTARWTEAIRGWFIAEIWKACNISRNIAPNLSDFYLLRLYSGGGLTFPLLVCVAEQIQVPAPLLDSRPVRALTEMAVLTGNAYTDIASYARERHDGQGGHNLIDVLDKEHCCGPEKAIALAVAELDRIMSLFLRLSSRLRDQGSSDLDRYIDRLGSYIRAVVDWAMNSDRYIHPDPTGTTPAFDRGGWADKPSSTEPGPLSAQSIAWWWEYDPER